MVTATAGAMIFQGVSGRRYNMLVYIADVVATDIKWSQDGAAVSTGPSFWNAPEQVTLVDFIMPSGPTVTVGVKFKANDAPIGQQLLLATYLSTLATRGMPGITFKAGTKITATEF